MTQVSFSQLQLLPTVERAITEMGFQWATPVQSEAIPLIRTGVDVITRSQTGTGKTVAFTIPAIEIVESNQGRSTVQVLILCPTRELAQQATEEIKKVARFKKEIRPVEVYGGASIDQQCSRLRTANMVIGTPGRIMDHIRRKTLKLSDVKMVILDEADEMLNMGFKEDIETILRDTPIQRQTLLFSATMPPAILRLTHEFQKNPHLIEINKDQMTNESIDQSYLNVLHDRKKEALVSLINFYEPNRAIVFCNTKKMVDELTDLLLSRHFSVSSIHSDFKQSQRTSVMRDFKQGNTSILVATDIAARGIDVSDVDTVINYDIPMNSEYYVHRIGRTGRAGKSGRTITLCCGRREISAIRGIACDAKSEITQFMLPSNIEQLNGAKLSLIMEGLLKDQAQPFYMELTEQLAQLGHSYQSIAAAAMQLHFSKENPTSQVPHADRQGKQDGPDSTQKASRSRSASAKHETVLIDIGSLQYATPNHIVGAMTEHTNLIGSEIGKVSVFPNQTYVEIPTGRGDEVLLSMDGCKICGRPVRLEIVPDTLGLPRQSSSHNGNYHKKHAAFHSKKH